MSWNKKISNTSQITPLWVVKVIPCYELRQVHNEKNGIGSPRFRNGYFQVTFAVLRGGIPVKLYFEYPIIMAQCVL